jgi:superfamily I DNA and RNA helicase
MKMTDEQVENMEYFDETYEVVDDSANQKRKFDEIWRMSLRYDDMIVTTCDKGTCRVRGFIVPSARAVIEHDIAKILK